METEEFAPELDMTEENHRTSRRQLAQQAINLAVQAKWNEAVDINRQIVQMAPDDAEAYNRLGKAYAELGQVGEAREAYESSLRGDAANLIAQRNLERLSLISEAEAAELAKKAGGKLDPQFFTEETGKTGVVVLQEPAQTEVLATLTAGDEVSLEQRDGDLAVVTMDGVFVGKVEDTIAARLSRLIQAGNEYKAGVVGVDEEGVRVIIREMLQAPQNAGRVSFPPKVSGDALPRPYVREGLLRRSADEDEDEVEADIGETEADDDDDDSSEFGFHEGALGEA
jgi:tetratricopeptide (TPR) repeat protein